METSATSEYPSLIHTFFLTHTVGGVFLNPGEKALYGLGSNTPRVCPTLRMRSWPLFTGASSGAGVAGAGMMSQEMMRTAAVRMRTIVRGYG
nr:hypothetical protein [Tanacetum cinerariifolium]